MFSKLTRKNKEEAYLCSCCGKRHEGLPMDFGFDAPFFWDKDKAKSDPEKNILTPDWCVVNAENFFIRGIVEISVAGGEPNFAWGVWVSLSKDNFYRYVDADGGKKELKEKPYFGWFSTKIPIYPDTIGIKTSVYLQGNKLRPKIVLDHSNKHPLCQEQHNGITLERLHEIIDKMEKNNKNN